MINRIFTLTILAGLLIGMKPSTADDFTVKDSKGEHLDIIGSNGKPILRYVYVRDRSTPEKNFDTAKVFAHVFAPNGTTTLTKGPGGKYPHHRGIFIGWNRITHAGKSHDLWHVRNTEQIHVGFHEDLGGSKAAVSSTIHWIGNHKEKVIEESRSYRIVPEKDAHAVIDFHSSLKAVNGDVKLNGDPEHAGVQFRPSQEVANNKSAKYIFHADKIDPKKNRDLPWVAETFVVDNQPFTVQHMNHPSNPKGARWSAYRDYGRFGPFTVVEIADGKTQQFRYRFRITVGEAPSRDVLQKQYDGYAKTK